jgi:Ulp1 family protease
MESIFALQSPHWLHDVIITWWLGYWCAKTGGLSNFSNTSQRQRQQNKIDCHRKTFFVTPFFWNYVLDAEVRGSNETKYVDIFTCSRMLIPVNIKLKHWILSCIAGEYAKPNTTATPHHDTPASGIGIAESLTKNETEKSVLAENAFASTDYGVLIGRETIDLTPIQGHFTATPHTTVERRERKKKKSGHTHPTHKPNNRSTCRHDTYP